MPPRQRDRIKHLRATHSVVNFRKMVRRFPRRPVIVAEGDSWFGYPPKAVFVGKPSNLIDHLARKRRSNILRLESNGAEAVAMLAGRNRATLVDRLSEFADKVDVLLFSGGGNDIVGKGDIEPLLKRKRSAMTWEQCIEKTRFRRKLGQIKNAYEDLLDLRNDHCPRATIITHGYDWPIPCPCPGEFFAGAFKTGPWMHPFMVDKGIVLARDQKAIARFFIDGLTAMLATLATKPRNQDNFVYVDLRGKLAKSEWLNEIHATSGGFRKLAEIMDRELVKVFERRGRI